MVGTAAAIWMEAGQLWGDQGDRWSPGSVTTGGGQERKEEARATPTFALDGAAFCQTQHRAASGQVRRHCRLG